MLRITRLVGRLLLPVGLLLFSLVFSPGNAAAQGTPEAREACTPDAMRVCSDFIPDVPKITKCMIAHYRELSEPCRLAMARQHRAYQHHRRHVTCSKGGRCA